MGSVALRLHTAGPERVHEAILGDVCMAGSRVSGCCEANWGSSRPGQHTQACGVQRSQTQEKTPRGCASLSHDPPVGS